MFEAPADKVLGTVGSFARWSESTAYHAIPNHDDIHECRRFAREVIAVAKLELRAEERWVVNPTSGTKQMSAGATLAALDEEVDQIDFTCGERVDGVVETGTEVVQSFDLRGFLFQRDLNGTMLLTAQRAWDTLATAQDPMADAYFADQKLQAGLQRRNESMYGHGNEPVNAALAQAMADRLRNLLREQMPLALACWTTSRRPHSLT